LPTEDSSSDRVRTQQIIRATNWSGKHDRSRAGSYAMRVFDQPDENGATVYLKKIDALGGMLVRLILATCITEIQKAAFDYQHAVETKEQIVVGVNEFRPRRAADSDAAN